MQSYVANLGSQDLQLKLKFGVELKLKFEVELKLKFEVVEVEV